MPSIESAADVVLLTRAGCHLCEQAQPLVERVAAEHGASVELRDVDADERLRARFTDHVPVLFVRGTLVDYWKVEPGRLAAALRGEPLAPPPPL